jgi:tetratricopeptide (TPR) repeat protein
MSMRAMRPRALSLVVALAVPAAVFVPVVAFGDPKPKPAAKEPARADKADKGDKGEKADKYDPDNITAISQYMDTVAKGVERFVGKDSTAAIDTFKRAIQLAPRNPLAHYLLAEAYLTQDNLGEASAAIDAAFEGDSKDATIRSHVLFVRAMILERQKKWDEAKSAWQGYTEHAAKYADAGTFPQSGAERVRAITKLTELEKAYVAVRERIAAEKADAGKPAAKK